MHKKGFAGEFLMYRVELKVRLSLCSFSAITVPNVPRGVESYLAKLW